MCIQDHALSYVGLVAMLWMAPIVQVVSKSSLCGTLYRLSLSKFLLRRIFEDIRLIVFWIFIP
jgi:hypothetical protein